MNAIHEIVIDEYEGKETEERNWPTGEKAIEFMLEIASENGLLLDVVRTYGAARAHFLSDMEAVHQALSYWDL